MTRVVKFPFLGSGRMVTSKDRRTVVMLQSNLPGTIDQNGDVSADVLVDSAMVRRKNPVVVWVFRDGKQVASHKLHSLISRTKLIGQSISHIRWLRKFPNPFDGTLVISTSDYREVKLDGKTGGLLSKDDDAAWSGCDIIATGLVDTRIDVMKRAFLPKTFKGSQTIQFIRGPKLGKLGMNSQVTGCFDRTPSGKLTFMRVVD